MSYGHQTVSRPRERVCGPWHPTALVNTDAVEITPHFSPDGKWLAYASTASGPFEVYVRPFPGDGGPRQISSGGGIAPVWSRA